MVTGGSVVGIVKTNKIVDRRGKERLSLEGPL